MPGIELAADDARFQRLRFAYLPSVVDRLAGEADVGDRGNVPGRNISIVLVGSGPAPAGDLAALLRRVILIGESALGLLDDHWPTVPLLLPNRNSESTYLPRQDIDIIVKYGINVRCTNASRAPP